MKLLHKFQLSLNAAVNAWNSASIEMPENTGAAILDLNIGEGLIQLLDTNQEFPLIDGIATRRELLRKSEGILLPPVRIRDDFRLSSESFEIYASDIQLVRSHVALERKLAVDASFMELYLNGMGVMEPESKTPGIWVEEDRWQQMLDKNIRLLTPSEFILGHIVRSYVSLILSPCRTN